MSSPEVVLLDSSQRYFRAAVLKARGYNVFTTEHIVEVCLRWAPGNCAALVIGPEFQWHHVATLCEWIKINSPHKPIFLLSDRRRTRLPAGVDAIVPTQPAHALVDCLRGFLPVPGQYVMKTANLHTHGALNAPFRIRSS